jgi:hypothetical protein
MTNFSPPAQWHPLWSLFFQSFIYALYPLIFLGISSLVGFVAFSQMFYFFDTFPFDIHVGSIKQRPYLQRQFHWSKARWKK